MKRVKINVVAMVILVILLMSAVLLVSCIGNDDPLDIDLNGNLNLKVNLTQNNDNLKLAPTFDPDIEGNTKNKELGSFKMQFLINDKVVEYDKIDIYYFVKSIEFVDGAKHTPLSNELLRFFRVEIKTEDGAVLNAATSEEEYTNATVLKLDSKYTVYITFDPIIDVAEYTQEIKDQLSGKNLRVTLGVFAKVFE